MKEQITAGILTVSDRCSRGLAEDKSGPLLKEMIQKLGWSAPHSLIVADEIQNIEQALLKLCDDCRLPLILTTGGTGIGPRDVTPEATRKILDIELPGFPEQMRREGLKRTPLASLSRAVTGIRNQSLVINLPGSPRGARESLMTVIHLIPHALLMIQGQGHETGAHDHR